MIIGGRLKLKGTAKKPHHQNPSAPSNVLGKRHNREVDQEEVKNRKETEVKSVVDNRVSLVKLAEMEAENASELIEQPIF